MIKEEFIKLIENIKFISIKNAKIEYITENASGQYGYGRNEEKVETIQINNLEQ